MSKIELTEIQQDLSEAYTAAMKNVVAQGKCDIEVSHGEADYLLCQLLLDLGFDEVVAEWNNVRKWYA